MTLNRRVLKRVHSPMKSPKRNNTSLRKKALIKQWNSEVQFGNASKANLKVVVRVRPQNAKELDCNARCIVKLVDDHMMVFDPKEEDEEFFFRGVRQRTRDLNKRQHKEQKFVFERVFGEDSTNEQIYEETTKDLVDTLLNGYNCSVFAYGATGAGKTFTMLGKPDSPGITFLTLMELYRRIEEIKEEKTCEVGISYLEVYNETVRDLLNPGKALNVQETGQHVQVQGLSFHKPRDADNLMQMLACGNQNRSQHPTDANAESSRSHAVFQ
ncbi:putative kinesin-like protein KIF18A-like, partial [Penaeus vannamei]